ncbi:hypothetical protein DSL72_001297 [Monilinia vaccinii-corymbosi]|uniref:pectin lyase n=1 Tax=Monilinia vaccinii-corymbosi TaxID=61207 RepID=A0A8A3PA12_9HELO|nr:hypothetical protein DSL72_001297 [Monilinia vaccinii-corymbosi]
MVSIKTLVIFFFSAVAVDAAGVVGKAEGFAASATGGGSARPAIPANIKQLVTWLSDNVPRTIVLDKTWDFTGSMGKKTEKGCMPLASKCGSNSGSHATQLGINYNGWCTSGNANTAVAQPTITYDVVGLIHNAIKLGSNKSIVGVGTAGKIKGRGFFIQGAKNIIIQNVEFVELNPQYVWGGDAINVDGTDLLWIDHVKTSRIGRQHISMGPSASGRVTISNCEFDGITPWSVECNNEHYWTLYFTGSHDQITFKGNYIHNASGRGPKVGGLKSSVLPKVFFHAVNNYWSNIRGNAFQIGKGGSVLAEGNHFEYTTRPVQFDADATSHALWSSSSGAAGCQSILGRACSANMLVASGGFTGTNTGVLTTAKTMHLCHALPATNIKAMVLKDAGIGKLRA